MERFCDCHHPDCNVCNIRDQYEQEIAKLREQLAARDTEHDSLVALLEIRLEAAEAKNKPASEHAPVAIYEGNTSHLQRLQDHDMEKNWRWSRKDFIHGAKLYAEPIPPVDVQALQQELATTRHNLEGAEAMCEMQMAINRKLRTQLEAANGAS